MATGKVDVLAIGIIEQLLGMTEQRLQLDGLKELALPALSALASEHLGSIEVDPIVMAMGKFVYQNAQRKQVS